MCGIVGLHLREPSLYPQLGALLTDMLAQMCDRGPDSAGMAIYGDTTWSPVGESTVSLLDCPVPAAELAATLSASLDTTVTGIDLSPTTILHGVVGAADLAAAVRSVVPSARVIGFGDDLTVLKGVGNP